MVPVFVTEALTEIVSCGAIASVLGTRSVYSNVV
jgi:hypothetical protein